MNDSKIAFAIVIATAVEKRRSIAIATATTIAILGEVYVWT